MLFRSNETRIFLDSCAGGVFRKRTPDEAEELITKISQNYEDWVIAEPTPTPAPAPTPTPRKRGVIELDAEGMREAKRNLKEKGIKAEDVKYLTSYRRLM